MDWASIKDIVLVSAIPLGIYLYHKYMKWTAPDSPGGENITYDELSEMLLDDEFWEMVKPFLDKIKE